MLPHRNDPATLSRTPKGQRSSFAGDKFNAAKIAESMRLATATARAREGRGYEGKFANIPAPPPFRKPRFMSSPVGRRGDAFRWWGADAVKRSGLAPHTIKNKKRERGRPDTVRVPAPPVPPAQQVANAGRLGDFQTVAAKKKEEEAAKWDDDCPICLVEMGEDEDNPPLKFPCTHIFCTNCITKHLGGTGDRGPCPMCRAEIKLSDGKQQDDAMSTETAVGAGGEGLGLGLGVKPRHHFVNPDPLSSYAPSRWSSSSN